MVSVPHSLPQALIAPQCLRYAHRGVRRGVTPMGSRGRGMRMTSALQDGDIGTADGRPLGTWSRVPLKNQDI